MTVIRSILFNVAFYVNITVLAFAGLPTLLMKRGAVQDLARLWARNSLWLLDKICGLKVEFRGRENLPRGACIIAAKHQSALETFALTTQMDDFTFVLKRELMAIPFFGWYLKGAGQIGIERARRGQALAELTRQVSVAIDERRQVFIFPEGTRTLPGAAPDYKAGVAHLCAATGAVCVPVALNSGLFWPRQGFLRRRGRVVIQFLPPIAADVDKHKFMRLLQSRIEAATEELIAEAIVANPSLSSELATV
ncbi:lysophospholipid acyltransferase family protein [Methylocella silvestris]|uniref:1-acyl-sn-glycerol-3-phosphate acyltransferase n=1 Tax=Methylocella silvestris TaxID=199596 RepID=A0A2J7TMT7_METSI|nr:lysophospholipid acyltransferase family protein [Methylocella silvestris]PNG28027.1 1-acyl-sn-glycerol-3-phosphate acyltransferase [Methylocella silvestris]